MRVSVDMVNNKRCKMYGYAWLIGIVALFYTGYASADSPSNPCLTGTFTTDLVVMDVSKATVKNAYTLTNRCGKTLDLSMYQVSFVYRSYDWSSAIPLNSLLQFSSTPENYQNLVLAFGYANYAVDAPAGKLTGGFSNAAPGGQGAFIANNQTVEFSNKTTYEFAGYGLFSPLITLNPTMPNPILMEPATKFSYGRDGLTDIPLRSHGLKTLVVTNYSLNPIQNISFPPVEKLPADISYYTRLTTCKLDGTQQLAAGDSCNIVYQYIPKISNLSHSFSVSATGVDSVTGLSYTSPVNSISYSSRFHDSNPPILVNSNSIINGIGLTTPGSLSYENNSLDDIPVGTFGLITYIVTNNSQPTLYALTLWPEQLQLPDGVTYDSTRSTCKLKNTQALYWGESCKLVLKYSPTQLGVSGVIPFQVVMANPYSLGQYTTYASSLINIPYSSR